MGHKNYTSELTFAEIASALGDLYRSGGLVSDAYYQARDGFMRDVASGRVLLQEVTPDLLLRSGHLLWRAGVDRGMHLRTNDAVHLVSALALTRELGVPVWFATTDVRLARTIRRLPDVCSNLVLKHRTT